MQRFLSNSRHRSALLALLALALYLPGFWWGAPHATAADRVHVWAVDAQLPLGPLAEIHNILEPKPDRTLGYPMMHYFVVAAAYVPYLALLWISGGVRGMSATYPYGLADPVSSLYILTLIAHLVTVLMAAGIVVAAYDTARNLWNERTGITAALLVAVSYPMFFYSRTGNVDVPMLFHSAVAIALFVRVMLHGFTMRRAVLLGIFVALATATKDSAWTVFLPMPFAILVQRWCHRDSNQTSEHVDFWKASGAAALVTFFTYGLASGLFVDPGRYFAHVQFIRGLSKQFASGEVEFVLSFPMTLTGHLGLTSLIVDYLVDSLTLPGLLIAVLGIALAVRKTPVSIALMLSAIAYPGIVLMLAARVAELRYVMPAAYVLVMFSAFGLNELWESRKNGLRIISALVLTYALGTGLAKGANMTYRMINDSRYAAGDWLADHTNPGDVIATFGPAANQPPLSPAITTIQAVPFTGLDPGFNVGDAEVRENLNLWAQEQPDFIIVMPDYTSLPGVPYSGTCHPRLCEGLIDGTLRGFRQVAFFESAELIPFLQRPTSSVRKREPTVIVSPPIRIFEMDPLAATESYVSAQDVSGQPARWE